LNPITVPPALLSAVLQSVTSSDQKEYGAARICRLLASQHSVRTRRVNTECSVGNISDQVRKCINPNIEQLGLYIACCRPARPFKNRYQQPTGEMLWSFYQIAANDSDYDASDFAGELVNLAPTLTARSSDEWERILRGTGAD
jgi:hypothetical protein